MRQSRGTTLRDLLTLPAFIGTEVVGGEGGLDRLVSAANVMEVPDIEPYVQAGELLLTTAYPLKDREGGLPGLIEAGHAVGLAGIALKPLRYGVDITDEAIARADELGLPLLRLPSDASFNVMIQAVLGTVLSEYGPEPGPVEEIRQRLSAIVLSGGGSREMAKTLAGALELSVQIVDERGKVTGQHGTPAPAWRDFPVTVAGIRRGHIRIQENRLTLGQQRLVQQACFALGLHLAQIAASFELDRRLQAMVLEELVSNSASLESPLVDQATRLGSDLSGEQCVVIASCSLLPDPERAERSASAVFGTCLTWSRSQEVVTIVAIGDRGTTQDALSDAIRRWHQSLSSLGVRGLTVAAGSVSGALQDLSRSHHDARVAISICRSLGIRAAQFDDLLMDRLLLGNPADVVDPLVARTIGPLIEYDDANGTELCHTLWHHLGAGNGAVAARRLHIHYNTLKYRLSQIQNLVPLDLEDPATRLSVLTALRIRSLRFGARGLGPDPGNAPT